MSQWDKLIRRVILLDEGLRFEELKKVLLGMDIFQMKQKAEAVTAHFEKQDAIPLPFQDTVKSFAPTLNW